MKENKIYELWTAPELLPHHGNCFSQLKLNCDIGCGLDGNNGAEQPDRPST